MSSIKLRIINKIGLLFVVIGFFLPISCNRENKTDTLTRDNIWKNKTGSLTWELNDGTLTISGKGPMPNYGDKGGPWNSLANGSPDIMAIIINDGVTNIGDNAFKNNKAVMYVSIPGSVTTIGENAFMGCSSIISINIPDGVINIDNAAFQDCTKLIAINISNSVLNIGNFAFQGCTKLITINIPDSVLKIGNDAFAFCRDLLNVTLGKNVAFIGFDAFYRCKKIQTVTSNNPVPPHLETEEDISAFDDLSEKCRLEIPNEYISAYKKDTQWNKFYTGGHVGRHVTGMRSPKDLLKYYNEMNERAGW